MLLPRILSGIVMVTLFLLGVFWLDEAGFKFFLGVVLAVAAWEWARLSGLKSPKGRVFYSGLVATLTYGANLFHLEFELLTIAPVCWLIALIWVVRYPAISGWETVWVRLLFGACILVSTWSALAMLKLNDQFVSLVLVLMGLIWGADTGAYAFGRLFGKRKLAVHVSPGKSWEGVIGGLLVTQIGIALFSIWSGWGIDMWGTLALIALPTVLISVLGDLTESLFKRHEKMKDSSQLIPGHGGVMDRIDSLTSAAPIYVLLLGLFEWM